MCPSDDGYLHKWGAFTLTDSEVDNPSLKDCCMVVQPGLVGTPTSPAGTAAGPTADARRGSLAVGGTTAGGGPAHGHGSGSPHRCRLGPRVTCICVLSILHERILQHLKDTAHLVCRTAPLRSGNWKTPPLKTLKLKQVLKLESYTLGKLSTNVSEYLAWKTPVQLSAGGVSPLGDVHGHPAHACGAGTTARGEDIHNQSPGGSRSCHPVTTLRFKFRFKFICIRTLCSPHQRLSR